LIIIVLAHRNNSLSVEKFSLLGHIILIPWQPVFVLTP
jgi:hypothetical protein